jgi:plasmid stabilization system protein ParE
VTYRVVFRPQAEEEARAARRWYEEQQPGLGERFATAIDETIRRIGSNPSAFPLIHGEIRRAVVRRFPLGSIFGCTPATSSSLLSSTCADIRANGSCAGNRLNAVNCSIHPKS